MRCSQTKRSQRTGVFFLCTSGMSWDNCICLVWAHATEKRRRSIMSVYTNYSSCAASTEFFYCWLLLLTWIDSRRCQVICLRFASVYENSYNTTEITYTVNRKIFDIISQFNASNLCYKRFLCSPYSNCRVSPLHVGTLKPHSNGPLYSNTVLRPRPVPPRCTKCNSPPINGQCTNFILIDVAIAFSL